MPYLYFGFEPRNRGATKLSVKTDSGELEPAEPSRVKVFVQSPFSPIWSLLTGLLGLAVAVLSFPKYSYIHTSTKGLMTNPTPEPLPIKLPGLAVVLKKGVSLSTENILKLEEEAFTSMQFAGRTVWLRENGTREAFELADSIAGVDPTGPCPAHYLNTHSFRAFLVLRSFTTRVCELFHRLGEASGPMKEGAQLPACAPEDEVWKSASTLTGEEQDVEMEKPPTEFKFKKSSQRYTVNSEKIVNSFLYFTGAAATSPSYENSGVLYNIEDRPFRGYIRPGETSLIKSCGRIFKFNPQLALPDPNLIGDIIGRYFLAGLGDSYEDQLENLELLKTGISGLRLTRVGEELTHLYKCIDIAIQAHTGLIPIFSKNNYEGSVLLGGFESTTFIIHGRTYPLLPVTDLKNEMLNVSDHASSLAYISNLFPEDKRADVLKTTSMVDLRELCLQLEVTQDIRDEIIRKASLLDFGADPWVINPNNISRCMNVISSFSSNLDTSCPIGRLALFSKDHVLVAFSCFGEKTCPSWDIPNGTICSLAKANPPTPPAPNMRGRAAVKGDISDATWVMVIRRTDLFSAVQEFKVMASSLKYRSTSSALAKRVGHRVFSRERMAEFWGDMREALRVVNPLAAFESDGGTLKRGATSSSATERGEDAESGKKRRMRY